MSLKTVFSEGNKERARRRSLGRDQGSLKAEEAGLAVILFG